MNTNATRKIRIGGASGFWGDSSLGAPQLVLNGDIGVGDRKLRHRTNLFIDKYACIFGKVS